jgi:hypothetical protein
MRAILLIVLGLCGCQAESKPVVGTGADKVVRTYFEAIVRQDWNGAYAVLHPETQKKLSLSQFSAMAQQYRSKLGFVPTEVHVQSCTERQSDAVAHLTLTGSPSSKKHSFKEGATLRRTESGWGVVLVP